MRILVAALRWFPDLPSGSSHLAYGHARYLARRGHEVWTVVISDSDRRPEYEVADGIHLLRFRLPRWHWLDPRRVSGHVAAAAEVLRRRAPASFDAVHGHTLLSYAAALEAFSGCAVTSYSVHSPVLAEYRESGRLSGPLERLQLGVAGRAFHRLERRCLDGSRVVTSFSRYTKALLGTLHGAGVAERVQVVPGWVDEERFSPAADRRALREELGLRGEKPVFFTLRRLVPRMGLDRFLRACGRLKASGLDCSVVIGGDGPLRPNLETLARAEGLGEDVSFLGRVADADLPRYYAACDAFVLPTAALECFGLIALEAMAAGRPVLATPVGALPEVVTRFEPAWLARDESAEAIEELLRRFRHGDLPFHDPDLLCAAVKREFGSRKVLPRLVSTTLGESGATETDGGPGW